MTDHRPWQSLAAARVDAPLEPDDAAALDAHLAGCAACRRLAAGLRADARALRAIEFGPAPAALRIRLAERASLSTASEPASVGVLVVAAALLLLTVLAATLAVGSFMRDRPSQPLLDASAIRWATDVVDFRADEFWIETAGKRYVGTSGVTVSSDPGNATYRTLELTWSEHGTEMRMNVYIRADATHWWIDELRTYDGAALSPDWLFYNAKAVRAPIGQAWVGNLDLTSIDASQPGRGPGRLHIARLQLTTRSSDLVAGPPGGGIVLAQNDDPFRRGGILHCTNILQLPPREAEAALLGLGYRLSWRLMSSTGPNTGYSQPHERAPDGVIIDTAVGSAGELIVFVSDPARPVRAPDPVRVDCPDEEPPTIAP